MKRVITLAVCLFISMAANAQKKKAVDNSPAAAQRKLVAMGRCELTGYFRDDRNHPLAGVQAFIYQKDSSIIASGYSDSMGHYETNAVLKGAYMVKVVYPAAKSITITGVTMKPGFNMLSIKANPSDADTTVPYSQYAPVTDKKTGGHTTKTITTTTTRVTTTTTTSSPVKKK